MGILAWRGLTAALVCTVCVSYNIDTQNSTVRWGDANSYFGYKVQTFGDKNQARIVVSAPLASHPTRNVTGAIYNCNSGGLHCKPLPIPGYPGTSVAGVGLSLVSSSSDTSPQLLVCAPLLSYTCGVNTYVNGICHEFDQTLRLSRNLTPAFEGCPPVQLDVAFLIDGSGSIDTSDFTIMKEFILKVMKQLEGKDSQFAMAQFSDIVQTEFTFKEFLANTDHSHLVFRMKQLFSLTYTPSGIKYVADKIFTEQAGARPKAKRLMIVITDGESNDQLVTFDEALQAAIEKKILRYAIGVGDAFSDNVVKGELSIIASSPSKDFVFEVDSYAALKEIEESLKEKIFAIEGAGSSSSQSSFRHELAQFGFSSLFTRHSVVLGAVGSYDWSGEIMEIYNGQETFAKPSLEMPNAYLGYSSVGFHRGGSLLTVVGAPRYRHTGSVFIWERRNNGTGWKVRQIIEGDQIGSYFGAELCSLDVDSDGETDLLLIGVPLYYTGGVGGIVRVCNITQKGSFSCPLTLRGILGEVLGRFGSTIAGLRDMDGDGLADVAVGAPLEDDHRGSLYIYQGRPGGVEEQYSQRIKGSKVAPGLEYFGGSIAGTTDLDGDGMTDLVVGGRGGVVILRSAPVLSVAVLVMVLPAEIPWLGSDPGEAGGTMNVSLCFRLTKRTRDWLGPLNTTLTISAQLDPGRQRSRLEFMGGGSRVTQDIPLSLGNNCIPLHLAIQAGIQDFLDPVEFTLEYCAQDDPSARSLGVRLAFRNKCVRGLSWRIPFKNPCKNESGCVTDLYLAANLTRPGPLFIKQGAQVNLTVILQNNGELARFTKLNFEHPTVISFRKVIIIKANRSVAVICKDTGHLENREVDRTKCDIGHPILKDKTQVIFVVTFDVSHPESLNNSFVIDVDGSSDNEQAETMEDNSARVIVTVRHGVNLAIRSVDSLGYISVSLGLKALHEVTHKYMVLNFGRQALPISVCFHLEHRSPIFLWEDSNVQVEGKTANLVNCQVQPEVRGLDPATKTTFGGTVQDSDWEDFKFIQCRVDQITEQSNLTFVLKGNLFIDGRVQNVTGTFQLRSSGRLDFNRRKYSQAIEGEVLHQANMTTRIEMVQEVNFIPYIAGGTLGGLLLLTLIALIFYKIGFFNRRYKNIVQEDHESGCTEPLNQPTPPPTDS